MLVAACLDGDRSAFGELVDRYQAPLFNAAYRITGSVDDAQDATQTAFVKAFEKLHTFDPRYKFFSWVYRIVINQSLNIVKGRRDGSALEPELADDEGSPEQAARRRERDRDLELALLGLSPEHRVVIVLKHLEGCSYQEIGELLGLPERTVKSRLFEARRRLRRTLEERGYTP